MTVRILLLGGIAESEVYGLGTTGYLGNNNGIYCCDILNKPGKVLRSVNGLVEGISNPVLNSLQLWVLRLGLPQGLKSIVLH